MRLVEIASFVCNFGPGPCRVPPMCGQGGIETDGSGIEFWRKPNLRCEATLKMPGAQTGLLRQDIDPGAAARCQETLGRKINSVGRDVPVQHLRKPTLCSG